jgi:aryl-alcohol dehydrogenase-like predicted oxidoreductase
MSQHRIGRRQFLRTSTAVLGAGIVGFPRGAAAAGLPHAGDLVALGRSGVRMPRLGMGTGSHGGEEQRGLGQEAFTRLVRHAFDRGIRYIDTADNYRTHAMVREAIKGLPREQLFILSKMPWERPEFRERPLEALDRYRRELGVEYIDALLIHCATKHTWPHDLRPMMDAFDEAKGKGLIRLKGVSCHGLPALTAATGTDWVDVQLARVNPQGRHMDGAAGEWAEPGNHDASVREIRAMHERGRGVIGMKIIGNGDFKAAADRQRSLEFVLTSGFVDAFVIGFGTTQQIDEAITRIDEILAKT